MNAPMQRCQVGNVIEFKPGCLCTEAPPVYKYIKNRHRLRFGNVVFIGETKTQNQWRAYLLGFGEQPNRSWFGQDLGGAA